MVQEELELPGEGRRRKKGDRDPEIGLAASALQKSIRASNEELAVGWGLLLWKKAPWFAWKRVLVTAAEDIGLADPQAVATVAALHWMYRAARSRAFYVSPHHLVLAIQLLARAPKSSATEDLMTLWLERFKAGVAPEVRPEFLDAHTSHGKAAGASWRDWYAGRVAMGVPINAWTKKIWALRPEWKPEGLEGESSPSEKGESAP